jgi:hypothetical protein
VRGDVGWIRARLPRAARETWLRIAGVAVITTAVTLAAACSGEDTVDTVPPPWPTRTVTPEGPPGPPAQAPTSTITEATTPPPATLTGRP